MAEERGYMAEEHGYIAEERVYMTQLFWSAYNLCSHQHYAELWRSIRAIRRQVFSNIYNKVFL